MMYELCYVLFDVVSMMDEFTFNINSVIKGVEISRLLLLKYPDMYLFWTKQKYAYIDLAAN